jgi:formate hydrogenlyase subunit 3/multisubunit Na+/H+ antiporter MnhD subunit
LIAFSTVAQLGYLLLIFPLARGSDSGASAWSGALIFLAAHALAKTAAFLAAGNIMYAAGHDRLRDFGGLAGTLPLSITAFSLAGLSLIGLPPTGGFAGKWLLLQASLVQGRWVWALAILLGSLLAAAYVLRVLAHAFAIDPKPSAPRPVAKTLEWTALALALLACGLGLVAGWPVELLSIGKPEGGVAP